MYFPPVAVGAVQEIPAPPLADPGDVRKFVADTRREQDSPRRQGPAGGRHPVAGQEPLHVSSGGVARLSGIDDSDTAPCPAQDERCAQAGRSAANHHHIVY
jgi:hypothetical protein